MLDTRINADLSKYYTVNAAQASSSYLSNGTFSDKAIYEGKYEGSNIDAYADYSNVSADSEVEVTLGRVHEIAYGNGQGAGSTVSFTYTDDDGVSRQKSMNVSLMNVGTYNYNRYTGTITRQLSYKKDGIDVSFTQRFQAQL